ncbi:MAG TPA: hypothetical protein VFY04_07715 [Solirubrobacterales bacterium]|nr:hypothetical protein [Solirubrobacterales bacterium]
MLDRAAHLSFADDLDQARRRQRGHVIIDVAEGRLQLMAEVLRGEGSTAVDRQHLKD